MDKELIYMDQQGHEDFLESIKKLKKKIIKVRKEKGESAAETPTDSWHDNFTFEHAKNEEMMLLKEYYKKREQLKNIEIVESIAKPGIIRIGTRFSMSLSGDGEVIMCRLVSNPKNIKENEVSINSPIGKGVLGKKEGDVVKYKIGEKEIKAKVVKVD